MRVLLLLTGGTLLMSTGAGKAARVTLDEEKASRDLAAEIPSLKRLPGLELDTRFLFHMDSANMQPADWLVLARAVHKELERYDGIVVVHGTDTMAYTASALALMLGPLPKPVVFTGAQRPISEVRTDGRQNLIDAVHVATLAVPEVSICVGAKAFRGPRATKRDAWGFAAFDSPNCAPLVELGIGLDVAPHVRRATPLADLDDRLEPSVLAVRVFPGLDPALLRGALRAGVKGLVLEAYGTGTLPNLGGSLIPVLEEARTRNVPVVVVSQCYRGFVELGQYEGGAAAAAAGAVSGGDMTGEAALAKLMIGLGRFGPGDALRDWLTSNVVDEKTA